MSKVSSIKFKRRHTWKNSTKRHIAQPQKYYVPTQLKDIEEIVREATASKTRVRAVGSGHSFSDVAVGNGYLINLKKLNKIKSLPQRWLQADKRSQHGTLVHVEAGITIQAFNRKMNKRNLCLENMGAVDEQTLAGAISTGTHGTGIDLPAMSGMVRSIVMVSHEGITYRIEPSNGLMDEKTYDEAGIILKQDDEWFNAALVNLGCFGIIYAYVVEVRPMYWLAETKEIKKWSEVKRSLLAKDWRSFLTQYEIPERKKARKNRRWKKKWRRLGVEGNQVKVRALSIVINPYRIKGKKENTCLISRHIEVEVPKGFWKRNWHAITRPWMYILVGGIFPFSYLFYRLTRGINKMTPGFMPLVIENAVKSLQDEIYVNKGHKVMFQGAEFIKLKAFDAEYAFAADENRKGAINAIDAIIEKAQGFKEENKLFQTSPIGMRFVQSSPAYLTPESGRDVCYVDTPVLLGTQGASGLLDTFQDIFIKFGGVPHWGKVNNRFVGQAARLKEHYTNLAKWEAVFKRLNPIGIFSNNFSDRLGLGQLTLNKEKKARKRRSFPVDQERAVNPNGPLL